jgi:hypothetical protein
MDVQQQWNALCKAFRIRDWETLEPLLDDVQERLDAGQTPTVSEDVSEGFNHAMASAGVAFIRGHFTRTDEWPVVDPHQRSLLDSETAEEAPPAAQADTATPDEQRDVPQQ